MTIFSEKNLYPGINAHLNSSLQHESGGWQSFHSVHVTHLFEAIDARLPEGYYARSEKTMQISEIIPPVGPSRPRTTTPDITVFRSRLTILGGGATTLTATPPTRRIPITEILTPDDFLPGITIYQTGEGGPTGKPITRIELLSPANKPGGAHYPHYLVKRMETLQSNLRLVEIDYLHESRPITPTLPSYPDGEDGAFPYLVLVSDPRPTLEEGGTEVYGIAVDSPLPIITIPLAGADTMTLNLGAVYNHTFSSSRYFQMVVDYAQDPSQFERYTAADRELIQGRLAKIRQN